MTLLERDDEAPSSWKGTLPITSRYTYGLAGERFFRALKDEGKILASYCPKCDHTYVPAVTFCERCFSELTEWHDAGLVGKLHTYTLMFVDFEGQPLEEPELVGFISFGDGGLIHKIDANPDELEIGLPMQAVLKPQNERNGSILDILYFQPVRK